MISGISAGAINAFAMSLFEKGDEVAMAEYMKTLAETMITSDVFTFWPGDLYGVLNGLLNERGIFDDSPLLDYLQNIYEEFKKKNGTPVLKRKIVIGSVDSQTAELKTFTEALEPESDFPHAVQCSASIPGAFDFQSFSGGEMIDGSTAWDTNIASAVKRCFEIVDSEDKITMDVILLNQKEIDVANKTGNSIENYFRYLDIKGNYKIMNDVYEVQKEYPKVNYRYLQIP